jgi:hypothetical protein
MVADLAILGAVAGSIGIASSINNVFTLLDKWSTAREAPGAIRDLTAQLEVERVRFILWCKNVGHLGSLVDGNTGTVSEPFSTADSQTRVRSLVEETIEESIESLGKRLIASQSLVQRYTLPREPDLSRQLQAVYTPDQSRNLHELESLVMLQEHTAKGKADLEWVKKLRWAGRDKEKFKELVTLFRQTNDGLQSLVNGIDPNKLDRQLTAIVTTTRLGTDLAAIDAEAVLESPASVSDIYSLAQLAERNLDGDGAKIPKQRAWNLLRLTISDLEISQGGESGDVRAVYGKYKGEPVRIEWRYYPRGIDTDGFQYLRSRVHTLAIQLQQSSKLAHFQLLQCLGYFHDETTKRFGMVFAFPKGVTQAPNSLLEILNLDMKSKTRRDLEDRYTTARLLAKTLYSLLSVRWLHKNICAENILFFNAIGGDDKHVLGKPYLCSFDFSRAESPTELTETLPSRTLASHLTYERRVYTHPDLDRMQKPTHPVADTTARYRREYDVYSLGVILLELGLWYPAAKLVKKEDRDDLDLASFRKMLLSDYIVELRSRMGRTYAEIVAHCISGGAEHSGISEASLIKSDYYSRTREYLSEFDNYVVAKLGQ